jgi:hypothetical protein
MKKAILILIASILSLSADYILVLTDKDGNQTQECIKSYSFSNNLESLAKKNSVGQKDVYSEEEVMTNKVYMGKPVYRKIVTIPVVSASTSWPTYTKYSNPPSDVETLISAKMQGVEAYGLSSETATIPYRLYYILDATQIEYIAGANRIVFISGRKVILEYTKTTDTADSSSNTFKSYLHYVPSSADTEEVITKDMKDLGVQFLEGYTYDSSTSSCIKN